MVITLATPMGVGKSADKMLPVGPLEASLRESDVWIELNNQWLLYSTPYDTAMRENRKLRHLCLVGLNVDMMIRCIGRVDHQILGEFLDRVNEKTKKSKHIRLTTPAGEEVEFENSTNPNRVYGVDKGFADTPGTHFMSGQIGWTPEWNTINGTIVFDGSIIPPSGLLREPVRLRVEKGRVVRIEGGSEARVFELWLGRFKDPRMFVLAHVCWAFNPGAKLSGNVLEDERVWGATEWGLGEIGAVLVQPDGIPAASHTDGISLNTSAWLDGEQILDRGRIVLRDLLQLSSLLEMAL
jgi:leucyl aminopeptidase (aminopeptidase T)